MNPKKELLWSLRVNSNRESQHRCDLDLEVGRSLVDSPSRMFHVLLIIFARKHVRLCLL